MKSRKIVMRIVGICATVLFLVILFAGSILIGKKSYEFGFRIFAEPGMTTEEAAREVTIQITDSMGTMDIARMMEEKGLCRDSFLFYTQTMLSDYKKTIKPGIYTLSTSMTANEILTIIGAPSEPDEEQKD